MARSRCIALAFAVLTVLAGSTFGAGMRAVGTVAGSQWRVLS